MYEHKQPKSMHWYGDEAMGANSAAIFGIGRPGIAGGSATLVVTGGAAWLWIDLFVNCEWI